MDGKKVYQIEINGIKDSISAVDALNKALNDLEQRIKTLEKSNVKVNTTSNSGGGNVSTLDEEAAIQREINKLKKEGATLDAKIVAAQDEVYRKVDATKELYKETIADQKALAAQERLTADAYSNTMQGMKQHLADLKAVINTTDLGDSDKIKQMTDQAGALTNKLKEMEEAYGQFGRNVGNYQDAANGFKALAIQVGDATEKFDNAKQALKELKKERDTLATKKELGIISEEEVKRLEDLIPTVAQLQSAIQDAGKPMDALMDTMQSFVAVTQATKGLGAFFGADNAEIEKTIKNLVALQNAMQGLQTIQKQINSKEGIGAWIAPFTKQIDKATAKLLVFNTALLGTGKAANVAAKGIKLAGTALKGLMSLGIMAVISIAVDKVMDLIESFNKLTAVEEAQKNAEEDAAKAYAEATAKIALYKTKLDNFNGTKAEEKKLVEEVNKGLGESMGQYKSVAEWQNVIKEKSEAYTKSMMLQAKAQAYLNAYTANYVKLIAAQKNAAEGGSEWQEWLPWNWGGQSAQEKAYAAVKEIETDGEKMLEEYININKEIEEINKDNKLFEYAPTIKKNSSKTKNTIEETQKTLNQLELRLMAEGLNKKLRQLDEEERQTINKLKENGRLTAAEMQKIQRAYAQLRIKEIGEYLKSVEDKIKQSAQDIKKIQFDIDTKEIDMKLADLESKFDDLQNKKHSDNLLTSSIDLKTTYKGVTSDDVMDALFFEKLRKAAVSSEKYVDDFKKYLNGFYETLGEVEKEEFEKLKDEVGENEAYTFLGELYEENYRQALNIVRTYGNEMQVVIFDLIKEDNTLLTTSFANRIASTEDFYDTILEKGEEYLKKQVELQKEAINLQVKEEKQAEVDRYNIQFDGLQKERGRLDETIKNFKAKNKKEEEALKEMKDKRDEYDKLLQEALDQHMKKMAQITQEGENKITEIEKNAKETRKAEYEKYFNAQLTNYRDFQSKLNDEISRNPVADKDWGIVNIKQTKKNYKEIIVASNYAIQRILDDKAYLEDALSNGLITDEVYNETKRQLNDLEKEIRNGMAVTQEASKNLVADFVSSIQMYLQAAMDSFSTIMNAVWDAQDIAFDKEQEEIDKANDALDKALDKQQEIIEQHKSAIESIEDELATARGDRRQHLIDQLNAEIEAQRRAQKEEQKIQKQKEAQQKKQDALELKRKKAEYHRSMLQAVVNGAMAVTMAAINSWPIPAIPMMALAASTTAAQIAIMAANKPYAKGGQLDGGVAQGKRHSEGGIPVLGGRASIEGGEFITNRQTTAKNVDLLEYINAKHRKLNIDDFIDFYSSGNAKKNFLASSPRQKFADGGVIPTLNNEYQFDDRLLSAFEDYSNRPVYVSVVDINSRQAAVKNVQVLAGLGE